MRVARWVAVMLFAASIPPAAPQDPPVERSPRRILGIIPNYQTYESSAPHKPITAREKFRLTAETSFDPGTLIQAAAVAGFSQWSDAHPSFGQGVRGYARYLGTGYADAVTGNFMSSAIFPTLLRQDPRYFRRGSGTGWSRLGYAVTRVFRTRHDSGRPAFNYSEVAGISTAVAISNAYYPDSRTAQDAAIRFSVQIGIDMGGNVLKEFWPDVSRKLFGGRRRARP